MFNISYQKRLCKLLRNVSRTVLTLWDIDLLEISNNEYVTQKYITTDAIA